MGYGGLDREKVWGGEQVQGKLRHGVLGWEKGARRELGE